MTHFPLEIIALVAFLLVGVISALVALNTPSARANSGPVDLGAGCFDAGSDTFMIELFGRDTIDPKQMIAETVIHELRYAMNPLPSAAWEEGSGTEARPWFEQG